MVDWHDLIRVQSSLGKADSVWAGITKVVETPAGFLFYYNSQLFQWLPRHGFSSNSDVQQLSTLAQEKAAKDQRKA